MSKDKKYTPKPSGNNQDRGYFEEPKQKPKSSQFPTVDPPKDLSEVRLPYKD